MDMQTSLARMHGGDLGEPAPKRRQLGISGTVATVVLVIVAFAAAAVFSTAGGKLDGERSAMAQQSSAARTDIKPADEFDYFPSHYVNQATEIEEHIQAF